MHHGIGHRQNRRIMGFLVGCVVLLFVAALSLIVMR